MRLLIIGTLGGQLTTATKLAMEKGANVTHADSNDQALAVLFPRLTPLELGGALWSRRRSFDG